MKEWKVGDEFTIIDPDVDNLGSPETKLFKIKKLTPEMNDNAFNQPDKWDKRVWFKLHEHFDRCQYVSKSNIRPLTKLERALK